MSKAEQLQLEGEKATNVFSEGVQLKNQNARFD